MGRMREVYKTMVLHINSKSLVPEMYQDGALTLKELESIQSKPTSCEANEALLYHVYDRPLAIYHCFLKALRVTRHSHVYALLHYEGT